MSKFRNTLEIITVGVGTAFAFNTISVPDSMRGKLPDVIDVASTASSIATGAAIGIIAIRLGREMGSTSNRRIGLAAVAISAAVHGAVESSYVNALIVPEELQVTLGNGNGGELRDFTYGLLATGLAVALAQKDYPTSEKPTSDLEK